MRRKADSFDRRCELDEGMQAYKGFIGSDKVGVLDHLLQERPINIEASHHIRLSSITALVLGIIRVEELVDFLVGFEADPPVSVDNTFAEGQVRGVDVLFGFGPFFAAGGQVLLILKVLRMGLVAGHFLNFADRNVIKVLHSLHIHVRKRVNSLRLLGLCFCSRLFWLTRLQSKLLSLSQLGVGPVLLEVAGLQVVGRRGCSWREIARVVFLVVILLVVQHVLSRTLESWVVTVAGLVVALTTDGSLRLLRHGRLKSLAIGASVIVWLLILKVRLAGDCVLQHLNLGVIFGPVLVNGSGVVVFGVFDVVHMLVLIELADFGLLWVDAKMVLIRVPAAGIAATCLKARRALVLLHLLHGHHAGLWLGDALGNILDVLELGILQLHQDVVELLVVLPELLDTELVFILVVVVLLP